MKMNSLQDLFVHELKDLYSAEKQLLQALPKMVEKAENEELRQAFEMHRGQTEEHVQRIERIMDGMENSPRGEKCAGMEGLIEEAEELLENAEDPSVRDAGMIGAAQRVEHYEIAGYGTARTYAEMLGLDEAVKLLQQTLDEEKETDAKLTKLAEGMVNWEAFKD
jgi:ferritin-like metal-binding protein YciE